MTPGIRLSCAVVGIALTLGACSRGHRLSVHGTDDIFAAGMPAASLPADMGTAPPFIAVHGGERLAIDASGTVACCTEKGPKSGPEGFAQNPFGQGSHITNSLSTPVGQYNDPKGAFALVGVFGGSDGAPQGTLIKIGAKAVLTVPAGATRLYLGLADANGFNGPSGAYFDNGGTMRARITELK